MRRGHHGVERQIVVQGDADRSGVDATAGEQGRQRRGEPNAMGYLRIIYSGLMPSRSRPSNTRPLSRSAMAKANMPLQLVDETGHPSGGRP